MEKFIVISSTFSSKENAIKISKEILNKKYAASIQLT